jgi:hypothetical protein
LHPEFKIALFTLKQSVSNAPKRHIIQSNENAQHREKGITWPTSARSHASFMRTIRQAQK